ncbi:phosphate transport system regulatory protein PhoU [Romboutsia weinsteinii]|uniref:Phosphate-specific transport system accessory protein PhoU n=1 Tax=Romboutsia weinsteinii TaxID=2020949 RepID=A0A371IXQ0_9FIRM|nr:phosphate signaling complex protein PhoU [Romboutsia weinsteinii]RDY25244.1 phosphate transport system regulatory protein PhoU [Romboutsia weinsteinii]
MNNSMELNINTLKNYTIKMMEKCETAIDSSIDCMVRKDLEGSKKVIKNDDEIDDLRAYIRDRSIELIALKQPMAKDLRYIYALGNIAIELERIGDYSENIAEETLKIQEDYMKELIDIPKMGKECVYMLQQARAALENSDENLAYEIGLRDNIVDDLYEQIHVDCLKIMNERPETINQGVRLLFVGRYLERIGDHITNVCEKIIYAVNGEMIEIG